jgi:hypothetical protein
LTAFSRVAKISGFCWLLSAAACTNEARPDAPASAGGTGGDGGSFVSDGGTSSDGGSSSTGGSPIPTRTFGEVEVPGLAPSACAEAFDPTGFSLSSGAKVSLPGPFVVLTGGLPGAGGTGPSVTVNGAARGVRIDPTHNTWSYFLAGTTGEFEVAVDVEPGGPTTLVASIEVEEEPLPVRDLQHHHAVGSWMFPSLDPGTDWACETPWQPLGGFEAWDGSVDWARQQLLDQIDAQLDLVGLVIGDATNLDVDPATDPLRTWGSLNNLLQAARELLDEGAHPPRLFPWLDVEAIAQSYEQAAGTPLDLGSEAGREHLFAAVRAFYQTAQARFGSHAFEAGIARFDGLPAIALANARQVLGADAAAVDSLRERFVVEFSSTPYLLSEQGSWPSADGVDERIPPLDASQYVIEAGLDGAGFTTLRLTPGVWDPMQGATLLPRGAGSEYEDAWALAALSHTSARHLWIDSYNDVQNGSGIFAAEPASYGATDRGPCNSFVHLAEDSWGDESRHYIDTTREGARAWNNAGQFDAMPVASDIPLVMMPGERRYVTVAMRNTGDALWVREHHKLGLTYNAAAEDFHFDDLGSFQSDDLVERFGGVAPGMTGVFSVVLTAPCEPGTHLIAIEIYDSKLGGFGTHLRRDVTVMP